jgi:hypothetical protein
MRNDIPFFYVVEIEISELGWINDWYLEPIKSIPMCERGGMIAGIGKSEGMGLFLEGNFPPHAFHFKKDAVMRERVIRRFLRPHGKGWSDTRIAEYRRND